MKDVLKTKASVHSSDISVKMYKKLSYSEIWIVPNDFLGIKDQRNISKAL